MVMRAFEVEWFVRRLIICSIEFELVVIPIERLNAFLLASCRCSRVLQDGICWSVSRRIELREAKRFAAANAAPKILCGP